MISDVYREKFWQRFTELFIEQTNFCAPLTLIHIPVESISVGQTLVGLVGGKNWEYKFRVFYTKAK